MSLCWTCLVIGVAISHDPFKETKVTVTTDLEPSQRVLEMEHVDIEAMDRATKMWQLGSGKSWAKDSDGKRLEIRDMRGLAIWRAFEDFDSEDGE
ncbi:MAG: hypothetical protein Q9222_003401 [Ikaeria aurantiellina]